MSDATLDEILVGDPELNDNGPSDSRAEMEPASLRLEDGAAFVLDEPSLPPAIWGADHNVLWSEDEPLMIAAPPGVGKSTVAEQIVLRRAGILRGPFLGYSIAPASGRVLIIAADRPRQIARSMARMVSEQHRELLIARVIVHRGPLPFDPARDPDAVKPFLSRVPDVDTILIDSLSAIASDLAGDEGGLGVRRFFDLLSAEGLQVLAVHHDRKKDQAGTDRVRTLDDVYGSRWITAGVGSVVYLDGRAGDLVVKLRHLKQPAAEVGPLELVHDHDAGTTEIADRSEADPLAIVKGSPSGATAREVACSMFRTSDPDRNQIEKARRRLDRLASRGKLTAVKGETQADPTTFRAVVA